jgi:transposase
VEGLLSCTVRAVLTMGRKRAYGARPARAETAVSFVIEMQRDEGAITAKKREMGWQVYGTNGVGMALPQVVWAYRGQYRIENDWSRLKGRPLGLTPLYLQDEGRIQGLVYLLSLALRVLTLVEWVVRARLHQEGSKVQGIYAGQPGRQTARPRAEVAVGGDEDDQRERGRGQRADARAVVAVVGGAGTPPRTLESAIGLV